jgi:Uma2 family endonuclease
MPVSSTRSEPTPTPTPTPYPLPVERNGVVPPLENGDRLTRVEFERRYNAMPDLKKAELIEGVVYVPSPVRHRHHGGPHARLNGWLFTYEARTPGLELSDNSTVRLDDGNVPQPDCVLFIQPEHGGKVVIDEEGTINGAPDLVAEVAASSVSYDVNDKLRVYQAKGVREYIVWRVLDGRVDWYVLRGTEYEPLTAGDDGVLRSTIFPGLWLDPGALVRKDSETLLAVLHRGVETPEHSAFKAELQRARIKPEG